MSDARTTYREVAGRAAGPVRLVAMLYEQMVEDLRRAIQAIDENHVDARTNAINHAILVLGHLQNNLNHEAGGNVARRLEHFYCLTRQKLLEAQFKVSPEILKEHIALLLELRDAWMQVEQAETAGRPPVPAAAEVDESSQHPGWDG